MSERLDKLLATLESQEVICTNGTLLVLGNSVLHSRLPLQETRQLMQYHKCRPLGHVGTRYTPIYRNGAWNNLYIVQLHKFVLMVTTYIDKPLSQIEQAISSFQSSLIHSKLDIPLEEPPILLRNYAKRETLSMLYHNTRTGNIIFPQLRAGPDHQQKELLSTFWSFFADATTNMRMPGTTEYSSTRDSFRFFVKSEGVHKLYLLIGNDSLSENPASIASEVLKNIKAISTR